MSGDTRIGGVLYDIDGVLVTSWREIDGAVDAVRRVRESGLRRTFLTNTTSRTCDEIAEWLRGAGFDIDAAEIVTAARLTGEYVGRRYPDASVWVLNHGDIRADLADLTLDDEHPNVIVIGGAGAEFTHRALSRVVELMMEGVPVVAMHSGLTWPPTTGFASTLARICRAWRPRATPRSRWSESPPRRDFGPART